MKLTIKGKDIELGESLRARVQETLDGISQRYFHDPVDATVSFGRLAHHEFSAHISLHVGRGISGEADGKGRSVYEALANAGEAVAKQLRRKKRKLRHHPRHDPEFTLDRPDRDDADEAVAIEPLMAERAIDPKTPETEVAELLEEEELPLRRAAG